MRFSLIVSTVGRTDELERLLNSLRVQTYTNFELVLVDQNGDDRLKTLFEPYAELFAAVRIRSAKGASRGRNAGIKKAQGDVVTFPDDDCWYPPTLLENVAELLTRNVEWDGLSGRPADSPRWSTRPGRITRLNAWNRAIEWTTFQRRPVIEKVGYFDETLGPGAETPWGAGEGTDYLIRALGSGFRFQYEPSVQVHHEHQNLPPRQMIEKSHRYAMGKGRVLRLRGYPTWFAAYQNVRPLIGGFISALAGEWNGARNRWAAAGGMLRGFTSKAADEFKPPIDPELASTSVEA